MKERKKGNVLKGWPCYFSCEDERNFFSKDPIRNEILSNHDVINILWSNLLLQVSRIAKLWPQG
jgi:hypothetical protein